jgi:hypothetical protein
VSTPDHAENTGDNLRHAAEVQKQAQDDDTETTVPPEQQAPADDLPDFNT